MKLYIFFSFSLKKLLFEPKFNYSVHAFSKYMYARMYVFTVPV